MAGGSTEEDGSGAMFLARRIQVEVPSLVDISAQGSSNRCFFIFVLFFDFVEYAQDFIRALIGFVKYAKFPQA